MWAIIIFVSLSIVLGVLYFIQRDKGLAATEKEVKKVNKEIEKMLKKAKEPKSLPIDIGSIIPIPGNCYVLGTFYDRDTKFCTFCHMINDKLISYVGVAEINDDNHVVFRSNKFTNEVKEKSLRVYRKFRKSNKHKFLDEE